VGLPDTWEITEMEESLPRVALAKEYRCWPVRLLFAASATYSKSFGLKFIFLLASKIHDSETPKRLSLIKYFETFRICSRERSFFCPRIPPARYVLFCGIRFIQFRSIV
jgi:hypothetical protein